MCQQIQLKTVGVESQARVVAGYWLTKSIGSPVILCIIINKKSLSIGILPVQGCVIIVFLGPTSVMVYYELYESLCPCAMLIL